MRRHHNESHVKQEVGLDHTVLGRAVTQHLEHRLQLGVGGLQAGQLGDLLGATERLQRTHATANQFVDHPRDEAVRQLVGGRSGLHPHRGQQHGIGRHRRGGKPVRPRYRARRGVERVAQAGRFALARIGRRRRGHLPTRSPLQHDHRQPRFFLKFRIRELLFLAEGCGVHFPEDAAACMLGKLVEGFESQRCDSSRH